MGSGGGKIKGRIRPGLRVHQQTHKRRLFFLIAMRCGVRGVRKNTTQYITTTNLAASSFLRTSGGGYSFAPLLLALVIWPLHWPRIPFETEHRSFLLLIETPPTFGRSVRFFHILHRNYLLLILSPSCFALCGHHPVSPSAATIHVLGLRSNKGGAKQGRMRCVCASHAMTQQSLCTFSFACG